MDNNVGCVLNLGQFTLRIKILFLKHYLEENNKDGSFSLNFFGFFFSKSHVNDVGNTMLHEVFSPSMTVVCAIVGTFINFDSGGSQVYKE